MIHFTRVRMDRALNQSRKQFEKCASSMSELNGFVWTEIRFV